MKKTSKLFLIIFLLLVIVACLTACGNNYHFNEPYTAYEISKVDIIQTNRTTCNYVVTCDIAPSETAKVYLTRYDKIAQTDVAIDYTAKDGKFIFDSNINYASYFIHVVDGEKTAILPMTRPQMTPSLTVNEGNNVLSYHFVNGTSWSSFCDPTGKSVYKSANATFDDTAEVVATNISISGVDTTTDTNPSDDKPYYYVVLSAKNGIVTYVSTPIVLLEKAFSNITTTLTTVNDVACLQISGKSNFGGNVAVELYSADTRLGKVVEIVGDEVSSANDGTFTANLDVSKVISENGANIWYDIKLSSSFGLFDVFKESANMTDTITSNFATFEFKEYDHLLKLNYVFTNFNVDSVTMENIDGNGVPTLVVKGTYDDSVKCIKLHADAEYGPKDTNGNNKHHQYWDNKSTTKNTFEFRVLATDLPTDSAQTWSWFHIYSYDTENPTNLQNPTKSKDLNRGNVLTVGAEITYKGVRYTIQAWTDGNQVGTGLAISTDKI